MAKMSAGDLKALLSAERYDALSAMAASKLSDERASALNYYMGNMSKDMPAPDGRSKAVSSDVADTIEGLMPPLMDIFASGDEVVQFAPVGPEDVDECARNFRPNDVSDRVAKTEDRSWPGDREGLNGFVNRPDNRIDVPERVAAVWPDP
jgi:hypothetical protein